jgi:hypothetical protein
MNILRLILIVFFSVPLWLRATSVPSVHLRVEVITPDGKPVAGAKVDVAGGVSTAHGEVSGYTDSGGNFAAEVDSLVGLVTGYASADGYYETRFNEHKLFSDGGAVEVARRTGQWQPADQTLIVELKPIQHPVPMYARHVRSALPALGREVGFDLEKGDWVAPDGKGAVADLVFFGDGAVESAKNYHLKLSLRFPGDENGIAPVELSPESRSFFRLPYLAPERGYAHEWIWQNSRATAATPGSRSVFVDESKPNRCFVFRVRSLVDADKKLVRADYGKIHGPVELTAGIEGQWILSFTYYLNPDGTRNLEFDPKNNLFKPSDSKDRSVDVRAP